MSGTPATGVPGGSTAAQDAASGSAPGVETTRSGSAVAGSSEVVSVSLQPASVSTQSAAAG